MPIALYMDAHVPRAITVALKARGVDVLTAQEDSHERTADPDLLERATELGRVLFSFDDDLLAEAVKRQRSGISFSGVIYAHPMRVSIGICVRQLEIIALAGDPEDMINRIEYLPL